MQSKTILVTGAAGFIGSNLVKHLIQRGDFVIGVDNFNDYYSPKIKKANLLPFQSNNQFILVEADIRSLRLFDTLFRTHQVDTVVHLAARAGVRPSLEDPKLYMDVNVMGSVNLLESMKLNQVNHLVFASSSSVYGNREKGPFKESDETGAPISPYSASKKTLELLAHAYASQSPLQTTGLRFFNVYGPGNRPDMAPYLFTDAIHHGQKMLQFGDGLTGRDYTYINDIVAGIVATIDTPFKYEIINLGNSQPVLLKDMIATLEEVIGKPAQVEQVEKRAGDVNFTFADTSKAKKLLDWQPSTTFKDGAKQLYDWYKKTHQYYS